MTQSQPFWYLSWYYGNSTFEEECRKAIRRFKAKYDADPTCVWFRAGLDITDKKEIVQRLGLEICFDKTVPSGWHFWLSTVKKKKRKGKSSDSKDS